MTTIIANALSDGDTFNKFAKTIFENIILNGICRSGGIGRRAGLKIQYGLPHVPVRVRPSVQYDLKYFSFYLILLILQLSLTQPLLQTGEQHHDYGLPNFFVFVLIIDQFLIVKKNIYENKKGFFLLSDPY